MNFIRASGAAIKADRLHYDSLGVLVEEGPPEGLRGVGGEHELDGLVLERLEHLLGLLAELDEALERLLDVGLRGGGALVDEAAGLELVPTALRDLHLLGQVGEVEHVREGARHDDGVLGGQVGDLGAQLVQL
jgi:hypothetical protein